MASRIHRRSGSAVVGYCKLIEFVPDLVVMCGVGLYHAEVDCMREEWGTDFELYGFEPHPATYKSIVKNFPGRLHEKAVGRTISTQTLYGKAKHKDGASLYPKIDEETRKQCQEFEVQQTALDAEFDKAPPLSDKNGLLWLDCEGNEVEALLGGQYFIQQCISVINVELTGKPRGEGWCKPADVHRILTDYGFLQAWIHTNRSSSGQCDAIYLRKEIFQPEYCSVPNSILEYEKQV